MGLAKKKARNQAKLSDNEIREINDCLEKGLALPEKYRFLLFEDKKEVELVWNGKSKEVCNINLPFQKIENIDEPRDEEKIKTDSQIISLKGLQSKGWTNKLIWGDNKLILSSLKNGHLKDQIEAQGGLKLIYIDPPFDVGADFSMNIEIGEDKKEFEKKPNVLEEIAYRDTWGKGKDSFIQMIYERLQLMKDLLADDGSIYVHCDWRVNSLIKQTMDEIFGEKNFRNEIIWHYFMGGKPKTFFSRKHDNLYWYSKSDKWTFNYETKFRMLPKKPSMKSPKKMFEKNGVWYSEVGVDDVWDISGVFNMSNEYTDYPTQKPKALLDKIIKASSNKGDLVADFFAGSGVLSEAAERLGRKWISSDLSKFSIHTTRKRMIQVQKDLKKEKKSFRSFEVLNLGKYERQHYVGITSSLKNNIQEKKILLQKEKDFEDLILDAYKAKRINNFKCFCGKKNDRLISIGTVNHQVTRSFVEEIVKEAKKNSITKIDLLAFEFEMGLFPKSIDDAKKLGVHLSLKYIPRDVFDKRAIEKGEIYFYDPAYIEASVKQKDSSIQVLLKDFTVSSCEDHVKNVIKLLKNGKKKYIVEKGHLIHVTKDKLGKIKKEKLTKNWKDWIDYWSVDFNFERKKEYIYTKNEKTGLFDETWTGNYIFENEWQSFRTNKDRSLEFKTHFRKSKKGKRKIAIKVVDIFGNDTIKIINVDIK